MTHGDIQRAPGPRGGAKTSAAVVLAGMALLAIGGVVPRWRELRGAAPAVAVEDGNAAVEAVRSFNAMVRHVHAASGDPRFAEPLGATATPEVADEVLTDVAFLRQARREVQDATLIRMDVLGVSGLATGFLEVRTREYWVFRAHPVSQAGQEDGPPVAAVVSTRYDVVREAGRWIVADWSIEAPGPGA